jgi:hypothetical protein
MCVEAKKIGDAATISTGQKMVTHMLIVATTKQISKSLTECVMARMVALFI